MKAIYALIVLLEPFIGDNVSLAIFAAGAMQEDIKCPSIFIGDLPKASKSAINDLKVAKNLI